MAVSVDESLKNRAFSAIMYCSAQLYLILFTVKRAGCHWLGQSLLNKTIPSVSL
jgi:hypothetical protein